MTIKASFIKSESECNPHKKKKKEKTTYLATFPKCRYNEYFKTTFPDDLERYDFEYVGIGVDLTSLKKTDFFFF